MTVTASGSLSLECPPNIKRRRFLKAASLGIILGLAGCGALNMETGDGVSTSAVSTLARIRTAAGLRVLAADRRLERAALQQARYMAAARSMTHNTGWGRDFVSRVKDNGIEGVAAENIAEGRMDIERLFAMWMDSPPHRRNMLDGRFTRFGLAYVRDARNPDWRYWALLLGT
ncbi:CAP domain-containing protein [Manganibacter manganicus]|uniref:Serine protease n=1 Tax=Manganibacter manganicus TaxID=1873176 RepID=A0A1V8RRT7_9HYPH|nr:CAP domain-containing protein [Pseudaminobacter manganicus]OQM75875.1 serine protease [Pseudaminobacter manganicus]